MGRTWSGRGYDLLEKEKSQWENVYIDVGCSREFKSLESVKQLKTKMWVVGSPESG